MTIAGLRPLLASALVGLAIVGTTSGASAPLTLAVNDRYYLEPATVFINVAVEPNEKNRVLRIEADGDNCFRSSDVNLDGEQAPRHYNLAFKNLPAGAYTVRAYLLSQDRELAAAEAPGQLLIMGK